jgi:endonuclease/exonuclease/phosphatase (EEP) superfamily protein YafD
MRFLRLTDYLASNEKDVLRRLGGASHEAFGPTIKLVSWNMFKARRRGWLGDLTAVSAPADLVLLQEAVLHGGIAQPFHITSGMEWVMVENLRHAREPVTSGPKTGSRVGAATSRFVRSLDREPLINTPKTFLLTTYPLSTGEQLLVLNVHAINFTSTARFSRQVEQMIAPITAHKGPAIVAGDFNTWNAARMHVLERAMSEVRLVRVPAAAPQWRHFRQVLDHVFYRGMRLIGAHALSHVRSSDHVPLAAEFDLSVH